MQPCLNYAFCIVLAEELNGEKSTLTENKAPLDDLVRRMHAKYDLGAEAYTRYISPAMQPARSRLLGELELAGADWLLDVGAGDGIVSAELDFQAEGLRYVAADLSMEMLRRAPRRPPVIPVGMDMRRLAFADACFDAAVLCFVIFHFPEIIAGLKGVGRVVKPGGWVGTLTFAQRPEYRAEKIWKQELARADAPEKVGEDLSPVDQVQATNHPNKMARLLDEAGFVSVRAWSERFEHRWEPEAYLSAQIGFGSSRKRFESLETQERSTLLERLRERLHGLPPEGLLYRPEVVFGLGRLPQGK